MTQENAADIIEDIRLRLCCMPVIVGADVMMMPAPDDVPVDTYVYPSPYWFMEAVRRPNQSIVNYALPYKSAEWMQLMGL
jgi:hypothetical protein